MVQQNMYTLRRNLKNIKKMSKKKTKYRIVPVQHETLGSQWALKQSNQIIGYFISKQLALREQLNLEHKTLKDFMLINTVDQELKIK